MDHVIALRRKVEDLRAEIARIRMLNQQERREKGADTSAEMSYLQRLARLEEIKDELARLSAFGKTATSPAEADQDERPSKPFLVKKAS